SRARRPHSPSHSVPTRRSSDLEDARGGLPRVVLRERAEVVHAFEERPRLAQAAGVQRVLDPPDEGLGEGGATARDLVEIAPGQGTVARVELTRDSLDREDVDVG